MWHIGLGEERENSGYKCETLFLPGYPAHMYSDDIADMVFELCDDISKCLGAFFGHSWTPSRGAWVLSFWGRPLMEGWGTEPREMAVRMLTLGPYLNSERVPYA